MSRVGGRSGLEGLEGHDGPAVFRQIEVEPAVVGVVADLVRLFAEVIDGIELSFEDLVVTVPEDGPWTLAVLEYVVPLATDIAALAADMEWLSEMLLASSISSDRLHTASLLASMRAMSQTPFPALEDLFARLGLPIDEPYDT